MRSDSQFQLLSVAAKVAQRAWNPAMRPLDLRWIVGGWRAVTPRGGQRNSAAACCVVHPARCVQGAGRSPELEAGRPQSHPASDDDSVERLLANGRYRLRQRARLGRLVQSGEEGGRAVSGASQPGRRSGCGECSHGALAACS